MSSSAVGLQSLPPELGALVLGHLCARDVLRTAAACKALRAIACATTHHHTVAVADWRHAVTAT